MGRWDCQRWRGKRGVVTLWQSREPSFWERGGCRWHVAKDGRCVVSKGVKGGTRLYTSLLQAARVLPCTVSTCMPRETESELS